MLRRWLNDPLIDVCEINKRLNAVKELKEEIMLRGDITDSLKKVYDIERLAGKMAYGNANARDMISLKSSVAKLPFQHAQDGISNTFTIIPNSLGKTRDIQVNNLVSLLDGYCGNDGQHINVNVLNRETLQDAMEHPEEYPQLTIRVSGYAVNFIKLTREQQLDVISRTFHEKI